MIHRMMLSALTILVGAGLAFAQAPPETIITQPSPMTDIGTVIETRSVSGGERNFWMSGEYLYSWFRGGDLPPLVTTSPVGTTQNAAGALGQQTTALLFGNTRVNDNGRSGLRLGAGIWLDSERKFGAEVGFMMFEGQATQFAADSNTFPIIARPFTDAVTGNQQALLVAFPGQSNGAIDIRVSSGNLYEWHLDLTEKAVETDSFRLTSLFGYRFYSYTDNLHTQQIILPTDPSFIPGTQIVTADDFSVRNTFHGIDMGFRGQWYWDTLSFELLGKVAFGNLHQQVNIGGSQLVTVPGAGAFTQPTGTLALASNSGTFSTNKWFPMPEGGAAFNWQIRPNLQVRLGYSVLVLNGIARPGNQIDTTINQALFNSTQAVPNRPTFTLARSDMWIQTVNIGLMFTY